MAMPPQRKPSFSYTGNASTTVFAVPFAFLNKAELVVTVGGVTKALTTDYTVTGGNGGQGAVTFLSAPANAAAIVIATTYSQDTSNPLIRRWNDLGNPIDGGMSREPNDATFTNQVSQKRSVSERSEAQALGIPQGVYSA